jgi:CheY-like chemotaxis protein
VAGDKAIVYGSKRPTRVFGQIIDASCSRAPLLASARSFMPDYTILLIDYDPVSAERLRRPLARAGFGVEIATDGLSGISRFHEIEPDLTLIEAMIPKKHGFDVCKELKQTAHGQRSGVWILTSVYKGRKHRTAAFFNYKCDEYLEKPISEDALMEAVNRFFEQRARQADVDESQANGAIGETTRATVMPFDPERSRPVEDHIPAPRPAEILPVGDGTYGGGIPSAAAPEAASPERSPEPVRSVVPVAADVPSEQRAHEVPKHGRVLLWIALALLAALGGLLVVTVLLRPVASRSPGSGRGRIYE